MFLPISGNTLDWLFDNSRFRNGWTQQAGHIPARIFQGTVIDVNTTNWTVDVISKYETRRMLDLQVGACYQHFAQGEGIYAMPEVGAQCMVCLPSDSSPPFVLTFVMPMEQVDQSSVDADAPVAASFGGGRIKAKPGDIVMQGRDGNYVILHRGGVLQIGAGPLAQRVFIPLTNVIKDFAEEYEMHTQGGSVLWGIQEGSPEDEQAVQHVQTYRVFANTKQADIRVAVGRVFSPVGEPTAAKHGQQEDLDEYRIGSEVWGNYFVYEVSIAPGGFDAEAGAPATSETKDQVTLRFAVDVAGNFLFRSEGNGVVAVKKNLRVKVEETLHIKAKNMILEIEEGLTIKAGKYYNIEAPITRYNDGGFAAAAQGDTVQLAIPVVSFSGTVGGLPATGAFQFVTPLVGVISSGRRTVSYG